MALVVVPDKIVTAICFPNQDAQPISNPCPHVTIAVNEWHPKDSNKLLEKSCLLESSPFFANYNALRTGKAIKAGKEHLKMKKLSLFKDSPAVSAYFVTLETPISFHGVTRSEY